MIALIEEAKACPLFLTERSRIEPFCALGEPDPTHCGKLQYPPAVCNADAIGRGEPWRSYVGQLFELEDAGIFLRLPPHTDRKLICRYEMEWFL
jgi:hypothetical protein